MNFQVTTALMSRTVFHTGASAFGLASAVFALGALGGALLAARRSRPTLRLLLATSFAFSMLEIVTGVVPDYLTFLLALVPTGLTLLTFTTAANSSTQLNTAPEMRGRVMGSVHARVPRRHAAWLAAGRLGGRGFRRPDEP